MGSTEKGGLASKETSPADQWGWWWWRRYGTESKTASKQHNDMPRHRLSANDTNSKMTGCQRVRARRASKDEEEGEQSPPVPTRRREKQGGNKRLVINEHHATRHCLMSLCHGIVGGWVRQEVSVPRGETRGSSGAVEPRNVMFVKGSQGI